MGYLNDRNAKTIIKDPERFPIVRRMWDVMLSGKVTPPHILTVANEKWGLRTRQFKREGGAPVALSAIYRMFKHPFYFGMIRHRGELLPGAHEPMVTKAEFDRVQELLGVPTNPRPEKHTFAFTGLPNIPRTLHALPDQKNGRIGAHHLVKGFVDSEGVA